MSFNKPDNIGQILDLLAPPPLRIAPGFYFAAQGILERSDPEKNSMNVSRDRAQWEFAIEIFRR